MIEWLPWLPSKSCYTNLKFFETLKDTPNPSKGFRFVAFLVLEILGGSFSTPPLVLGVGTKTLGARRVNAKGPTAIESPARPGQMDQIANADVLVGSKDEVTTHHGDKSNDLIWETLKTIQMQIAGMQRDFSRSTSKRRSRSR